MESEAKSDKMSIEQKIRNIENIRIGPLTEKSNFVIPLRMEFTQCGRKRKWDLVQAYESVVILIFNVTRKVFVLVKQFRPAVLMNSYKSVNTTGTNKFDADIDWSKVNPEMGITIECCAGVVDKPISKEEIAREEVLEECGYSVPVEKFQHLNTYRSSVGLTGEKQILYYVEVTDDMKTTEGGGNIHEAEFIEVIEMSIPEAKEYIKRKDLLSAAGFLYAFSWFFLNKAKDFE